MSSSIMYISNLNPQNIFFISPYDASSQTAAVHYSHCNKSTTYNYTWPHYIYQDSQLLLSTLLVQVALVHGQFEQSNMHSTHDFCSRLSILESFYLAGRRSISKQTDCKLIAHSIFDQMLIQHYKELHPYKHGKLN